MPSIRKDVFLFGLALPPRMNEIFRSFLLNYFEDCFDFCVWHVFSSWSVSVLFAPAINYVWPYYCRHKATLPPEVSPFSAVCVCLLYCMS